MIFLYIFLLNFFSFVAFGGKNGKILTKIDDFWKLILNKSLYTEGTVQEIGVIS
jgi:hypothetical protein